MSEIEFCRIGGSGVEIPGLPEIVEESLHLLFENKTLELALQGVDVP